MIIGYWNIAGKAQGIRLLLLKSEIPFTDKLYTFKNADEWFSIDKKSLDLPFANLPYLINGDFKLSESNAIITYIVKMTKQEYLLGQPDDLHRVEELRLILTDMQSLGFLASSKKDEQSFNKFIEKMDAIYKFIQPGSSHIFGYLTVADFLAWEPFTKLKIQWPDIYVQYADKFDQVINSLENIPAIKAYLQLPTTPKVPKH